MQIRLFKFEERLEREICFKTIIFIIQKNTLVKLGKPTPFGSKELKKKLNELLQAQIQILLFNTDFAWIRDGHKFIKRGLNIYFSAQFVNMNFNFCDLSSRPSQTS